METGKNDKILAIIIGAAGLAVLAVTVFGVLLWGPIRAGASEYSDPSYDGRGGPCVFLEPVLSGRREREKARDRFTQGCQGLWDWQRESCCLPGATMFFLPMAVSGIYMAVLILAGRQLLRLFLEERQLSAPIPLFCSVHPCALCWEAPCGWFWYALYPFTGHGGLMLWRGLAAVMALMAVVLEILWGRRNKQVLPGAWLKAVKNSADTGRSESMAQAALLAFIITMVLIQAGRMNIELDYDSLHYGLRSAYVLDNGKGIYENLGMINLVYTYSKGLEVLVLPLSGTPTYGFVLAFSLW